jgi:tetratricopeptide (TPR) repeat protein
MLIAFVYASIKLLTNKSVSEERKKQLKFSAIIYIVCISIVIFIPVGKADVADRYTYIPFIGLSIFFFLIVDMIAERWFKHLSLISGVGFLILFSVLTFQRNKVWKNSDTLWSDVIRKYPSSEIAYYGRGNFRQSQKDFKGALIDFNKAIDLRPDFALALNNRGAVKLYLQDLNGALMDLNRSISINPSDQWAYYNRALVYLNQDLTRMACNDLVISARLGNSGAKDLISKFCK